jgi:hypothetical protein
MFGGFKPKVREEIVRKIKIRFFISFYQLWFLNLMVNRYAKIIQTTIKKMLIRKEPGVA